MPSWFQVAISGMAPCINYNNIYTMYLRAKEALPVCLCKISRCYRSNFILLRSIFIVQLAFASPTFHMVQVGLNFDLISFEKNELSRVEF